MQNSLASQVYETGSRNLDYLGLYARRVGTVGAIDFNVQVKGCHDNFP